MKTWLQSRTLREQLLVTVLIVVFALIWLLAASDRLGARVTEWRAVGKQLAAQQLWLDQQTQIEARAADAVKNLDPARTHDATKLNAAVTAIASQAALQPSIDAPQTTRTPQFSYHTVRVTFRRASLPALLAFYDELTKQVPYLNLEAVTLQADRSNVGMLNVTLQISATQIAPPEKN